MRALVTGAGGLIGLHLAEALATRGDTVHGWIRRSIAEPRVPGVNFVTVDITDGPTVHRLLDDFAPEIVFHLAALSSPGQSWQNPAETYTTNVVGTVHLLEAARKLTRPPRLLLAGSSAEYAEPASGAPITEDAPIEPNSPYAASKVAMTQFADLFHRRYALGTIVFRPFFVAGPRKIGDVCSDFARRIVAIERGKLDEMRVGALSVVRDIMDVRDCTSALLRIADAGQVGEIYNIASGQGSPIRTILDILVSFARVPINIAQDPALLRPLEQNAKIGDPNKLMSLGWRRVYSSQEMLASILEYWRHEPA